MKNKRQLVINLISSSLAFAIGPGINLVLYPYIIKHIGVEAFGFAALAVSFTGYAQLVTIAINSMAGRFITVKIHEDDYEGAVRYFNSVLITNIIIALFLLITSVFCIIYLEKMIKIPQDILLDVKALFSFIFAGFLINAVDNTFGVGVFATNRLDISSGRDMITSILRGVLLFCLFYFFRPRIAYLGAVTLTITLIVFITNIFFTRKLLPELKFAWKFDPKAVLEIASAGAWNVLGRLGGILTQGIDLLIANIFISAKAMGVISVSKTIPILMVTVAGMLNGVFAPQVTISYAQKDFEEIKKQLGFSIKMLGMMTGVPIAIATAFGTDFYRLWVPGQDAVLLYWLTMTTIISLVFSGPMGVLGNVFTATNRIKTASVVIFFQSLLSAITVLTAINFIKNEDLGMFVIVGVGSLFAILMNITFIPIYAARCLDFEWHIFYPLIARIFAGYAALSALLLVFHAYFIANTWVKFGTALIASGVLGLALNFFIMFKKEERKRIIELFMKQLKTGGIN